MQKPFSGPNSHTSEFIEQRWSFKSAAAAVFRPGAGTRDRGDANLAPTRSMAAKPCLMRFSSDPALRANWMAGCSISCVCRQLRPKPPVPPPSRSGSSGA